MRVGTGGAEGKAAAGLAFVRAGHTDVGDIVDEHVGVAGLDTRVAQLVVPNSAVDALSTSVDTSFAFGVAGFAFTIDSQVVGRTLSLTNSLQSITVSRLTSSTVGWVSLTSSTP